MRLFKRLYWFILKSFLPLFAMTFFIVLFIVLMQFLWRYIDDLVGKGLSVGVLGELFFYAAVSMVPMALPLAILLASLMTFGNLGEKSELTAIKAAGVPLIQTMSPLIIFISLVSVCAFFFQNDVLPRAQVKMWTLLFSARQKSPELEIPEGAFYDQIPGYNLYVKSKNPETGMLQGVMIYDVSKGGDNSTILLADSARLAFTKDMRYLYLRLFNGEQFENLREQKTMDRNVPFRRETFLDKEVLIPFDANFNKIDESGMRNQYIGKNISQLRVAIDSLKYRVDSIGNANEMGFRSMVFPGIWTPSRRDIYGQTEENSVSTRTSNSADYSINNPNSVTNSAGTGSAANSADAKRDANKDTEKIVPMNLDSIIMAMSAADRDATFAQASNLIRQRSSEIEFRAMQVGDEKGRVRRNEIELMKKFTLSVACLIFLFIGAPLGAIIRKGGLGTPLVISVLLFLVYYIIDNTGYKLARDGRWEVWAGIWLSTFVLVPLGVFVTYKAMNDSAMFNADLYKDFLRRLLGLQEKRLVPLKDVVINDVDPAHVHELCENLQIEIDQWLATHPARPSYSAYWQGIFDPAVIINFGDKIDALVNYAGDSKDVKVIDVLNRMPVVKPLWVLRPTKSARLRSVLKWFLPVGVILYLGSLPYVRRVRGDMKKTLSLTGELEELICPAKNS